eukprot:m.10133 g.10133  ORF g.10133 m.10133 type:complete len:97 (-) comp5933_c0_seq1:122-412(-)
MVNLYLSDAYAVPSAPTIVAFHWNRLSPSGKALMDASFDIMTDISSCRNLFVTPWPAMIDLCIRQRDRLVGQEEKKKLMVAREAEEKKNDRSAKHQ